MRKSLLVCVGYLFLSLLAQLHAAEGFVPSGVDIRREAKARQKGWIVLVYGGDWSPAGAQVQSLLASPAFRNEISVRYLLGFVNLSETPPKNIREEHERQRANAYARGGILQTVKTPALFVGDKDGELFLIWENISEALSLQTLLTRLDAVAKRQAELKSRLLSNVFSRNGLESAAHCGEFLESMIPFLGSAERVLDEKAYLRVWNRLCKLDPQDKTGWQRCFTLGNGEDIVKEAAAFALKKEVTAGEAFLAAERAKPSVHLSIEQRQALDMADFLLCREDESRREKAIGLLQKVCQLDASTVWGVAAMSFLEVYEKPVLSVPYGWHPGDIQRGSFKMKVSIGVKEAFPAAGRYEVSFSRMSFGGVNFNSLELFEGFNSLLLAQKPMVSADGLTTTFTFDFYPEYGDMVTSFVVTGLADAAGSASSGSIHISYVPIRARKSANVNNLE